MSKSAKIWVFIGFVAFSAFSGWYYFVYEPKENVDLATKICNSQAKSKRLIAYKDCEVKFHFDDGGYNVKFTGEVYDTNLTPPPPSGSPNDSMYTERRSQRLPYTETALIKACADSTCYTTEAELHHTFTTYNETVEVVKLKDESVTKSLVGKTLTWEFIK